MSDFTRGPGRSGLKREHLRKRAASGDRGERIFQKGQTSLRDEIAQIDQNILRLLLKRFNLAAKISQNGRMPAADEKFLREKWQTAVARISKDADLSSRFFALLQEISFLPRPEDAEDQKSVDLQRGALIFFPPRKEPDFSLDVPADTKAACSWAYMAAASGQALSMENAPDNSPARDCMNAFLQMGANLNRDRSLLEIRAAAPMGQPDRVLYAGESEFNFFLFLAHYLGKASRVKITGGKALNLADFTLLRHFLPSLGARLVHIVPRSGGLPVRVECSGILPAGLEARPDLPEQLLEALLLASPFYERPLAIDFHDYPHREAIFSRILPIFEQCAVIFTVDGSSIAVNPSSVRIPDRPLIPMDPVLSAFLLLIPEAAGGKANLRGYWPERPEYEELEKCFAALGGRFSSAKDGLLLERERGISALNMKALAGMMKSGSAVWKKALVCALGVCACLHKGEIRLPSPLPELAECQDFLRACGMEQEEGGPLQSIEGERKDIVWNAPGAVWALALAACACARKGKNPCQLGNPGIVSEIWIPFWTWYRNLTRGGKDDGQQDNSIPEDKPRRRIRTSSEAVLPEPREEDLD